MGTPSHPAKALHYHGPDLLRLFAALLVVLFHVSETGGQRPSWPVDAADAPLGWLHPIAWMGWIGVQMFFVLSGFLIAASAVNSAPLHFLKKRAVRIFPALWISCLVSLVVRAAWGEPLADLLPALMRAAVLSPRGPYIDGVVWSLVVEAAFYGVVAATMVLCARRLSSETMLVWTAYAIGTASTAFEVACRAAVAVYGAERITPITGSFLFDVLLLRQGMFFAIGMLLFHLVDNRPSRSTGLALAVFSLAACLQIADTTADTGPPLVPILIWAAATALLFASVKLSGQHPGERQIKVSRQLGLMTYPLYLNHFVLSQALVPVLVAWLPGAMVFPVLMAILLGNAWLIAAYPERWIQDRLSAILSLRRRAARPAELGNLVA